MIPFITTRTEPSALAWGCALAVVTRPWVAQRVWPRPAVAPLPFPSPAAVRSSARLPTARTDSTMPCPSSMRANPAES